MRRGENEWVTRGLTGMVFVLVVMGAVAWAAWSNALLWALVAALTWSEWFKAPEGLPTRWPKALLWLFPVPALAALIWLGVANPYDPWPILSFLWMIWANDTGAFVVGKPLGKHKLWPSVSPGKSWEGTVGGAVMAALVAALALGPEWAWLGGLMGALSTAGDLTQSAWKRRRNMKDSGNLLPGHGGIMDRFDGFLYAAPVYVILWCIFAP
ncbi:MAG: phosphatidate cytidylyltransferase [Bacteroidota bacterium]|nr:phosphatidate cytidylyltransferase [Bacteroidota bacterium]